MTQPIDQSTLERMVVLVREIAEFGIVAIDGGGVVTESRAIAALLPARTDPDLVTAREIVANCCTWFSNDNREEMEKSIIAGEWDAVNNLVPKAIAALRKAREVGPRS